MFHQIFDRLFRTSSSGERTRRTPAGRRSAKLQIFPLEDRVVPSDLLGTAASFAVLGGQTVTNTGPSVINGDLGVNPGAAVIGFPPGIVTPPGTIHAADAVALQAQSDTTIAYNDLAGRSVTATLTGQDLGGLTLTPGVYFFSTSAQLTGTLTLDFQGNPDALFVFQIGSTLTTASNSSVAMINGGVGALEGCEVYWQVGSSATLGTTTSFVGNIVALTSISLTTGANIVSGRALARNGAVTLDTNVITMPDCLAGVNTGSISGLKFNDLNGNGVQNAGEPGLQGVTVFLDANGNGVLDAGEATRITDVNGNYTFAGLAAGTYLVRQVTPPGIVNTTPNPVTVTLTSGQNVTGVNFGDFRLTSIGGTKFRDTNGNGVRNAGEPGLKGWTIFLDANRNGRLDAGETRTTTDANGNYTFANLAPGTYSVREVRRLGWVQMTNNPADIVITTSGQGATVSPFGNAWVATLISPSKLNLIGSNMAPGVLAGQARFVENLYLTLLGRAPDLAGLKRYIRLLQAGFSQPQVTAIFRGDFKL
jgi:uncharacterized protein (DUF2141 family)